MLKYATLIIVFLNGITFAQDYLRATVSVKAKLIEGTAISIVDHELLSEQFSKIAYPQLFKYDSDDIFVHISGYKNNLMVNYSYVNFSEFDSIKENRLQQIMGTHSILQYINDQDNYFLFDEPFSDPESITKEKSCNKICYISLVYN